ncbi:MAG: DUF3488 and transglutaminase-like domain-containing protein [Candidatus Nanopelagicales bacterium]
MPRPGVRQGRGEVLAQRLAVGRWFVGAVGGLAVVVSSLSLAPLVDNGWWLGRTAVVVAVIVVSGAVARTLRVMAPLQPLVQFAVLLATLVALFARDEAPGGVVPGPAALGRLRDLAVQGREYANATTPPAGPDVGLLLLIVAGIGLTALVVDTLAAGLDLPGMTILPLAALFVVPWAVNRGVLPGWAFVLVALAWLALVAAMQRERTAAWSPGAKAGSPGVGLVIAAGCTSIALLVGGLATLRGPADVVDLGAGPGTGTIQVDELVSLRRSLVSNDTRAVLTMASTAEQPDYLRTAVLEFFDGVTFSRVRDSQRGPTPPASATGAAQGGADQSRDRLAEYRLDVGPLGGSTLPSPAGSVASLNDWAVQWDQRTSLPIRVDGDTIEGARIGLVAQVPEQDPTVLRAASRAPIDPQLVLAENLADPGPLVSDELPRLAQAITADSSTPFDSAVALQRWFTTDGGFTYSTAVEGPSGGRPLADFLAERVGYCEQFAATMALMARSVGIPARVVVGFTQGSPEGEQWVVRGTDAHAWPELWMGSAGWIRFEPTPGAATSITPAYSREGAPDQPAQSAAPTEPAAPTQAPDSPEPDGLTDDVTASDATQPGSGGLPLPWLVLAGVLVLALVPGALRMTRRRERLRAADGQAAFAEVVDTLVDLGLGTAQATPRMTLARVAELIRDGDRLPTPDPQRDPHRQTDPGQQALDRILRAVEWERYGADPAVSAGTATSTSPGGSGPTGGSGASGSGPTGNSGAGGGRGPAGAAGVDAGVGAGAGAGRPADLAPDVRCVRRALSAQVHWSRRVVAILAPRSVLPTGWRLLP